MRAQKFLTRITRKPPEGATDEPTQSKLVEPSRDFIGSTAAHENKPNWRPTLNASTGVAKDRLEESPDAYILLKSVAECLSTVLQYYDVSEIYPLCQTIRSAHF